jgi:hypothetical protein
MSTAFDFTPLTPDFHPEVPREWMPYQPACDREKILYDIRLRDGTQLQQCYPNGNDWNAQIFSNVNPAKYSRIADYRVTHIKPSNQQL